jgi:hypothetical protein
MKLPIKTKREYRDGDEPVQGIGNERSQVKANLHARRHGMPSEEHRNSDCHIRNSRDDQHHDADQWLLITSLLDFTSSYAHFSATLQASP